MNNMSLGHPPIPENLRPHVWAKSLYNYPAFPNLGVQAIADFLFTAMNIATATPFRWDFLDCPAPGSLIFVWMSPQSFAQPPTDGYQYLDPEHMVHLPVNERIVEVYEHKYGYNPRTDSMTSYVRRRMHLVQGGNPQLWLIHYLRAPEEDRLPVSQAPVQPYIHRPYPLPTLADIKFTLSPQGHLVSFKSQNTLWPANMAPVPQHYAPQPPYLNRPPPVQPPPYRPPQQMPVPANKRIKVEEDEEEESFAPRDVAAQRFVRWTEWMEEILSSGYNIHDILPPPGPGDGMRVEVLKGQVQELENDIRISKQRHEESLLKFKNSCKVWKEGTKKLTMTATPIQDILAGRVDGVAAAAKDAESAISLAITQPSTAKEVEEINKQVLAESGIPNARIRTLKKVRPIGKHVEYQPARKSITLPPGPTPLPPSPVKPTMAPVIEAPPPVRQSPESVPQPVHEEEVVQTQELEQEPEAALESDIDEENGEADEAFETMEAMEFDADAEFGYGSDRGADEITMDLGVD